MCIVCDGIKIVREMVDREKQLHPETPDAALTKLAFILLGDTANVFFKNGNIMAALNTIEDAAVLGRLGYAEFCRTWDEMKNEIEAPKSIHPVHPTPQ